MMAQIEFLKHNYYCTTVNLNMKDAFVHYLKCYELMGKDGSKHKERRKECFLHMIALGIQCGMWLIRIIIIFIVNSEYCILSKQLKKISLKLPNMSNYLHLTNDMVSWV